jgi:Zn-finger nucleic acid-binding protein
MITRNCPICAVPLEPETYEGFPVLRCPDCSGHLVDLTRYESIRRLPEKSLAELEAEAQAGFQGDNPAPVRCPRCHLTMHKKSIPVPGFSLHMDVCRGCALVWLDGGELAMAQLAHQGSASFRDIQDLKRRSAALEADPDRKAAFEEALAKLPETTDPFTEGLHEAVRDALFQIVVGTPRRWPRI